MCLLVSQSILSICLSIRLSINLSVKLTATGRHAGRHASKACRQIGRQAGEQFDSSNLMPALRSASGFAASRTCFCFLLFLITLQIEVATSLFITKPALPRAHFEIRAEY